MTTLHWILVLGLGLVLLCALGYHGAAAIGRALFDAPPRRRGRDWTAPADERERMIPMIGSDTVEYTQVVKRTEAGSTITALHLTPKARRGLTALPPDAED